MESLEKLFESVYFLSHIKEENLRTFLGKAIKYITRFDDTKTYSFEQIFQICNRIYETSKKSENWQTLSQNYFEGKNLDEFISEVCINTNKMKKSERPQERSLVGISDKQAERTLYFLIVYSLIIEKERLNGRLDYQGGHFSSISELDVVIQHWKEKINKNPR